MAASSAAFMLPWEGWKEVSFLTWLGLQQAGRRLGLHRADNGRLTVRGRHKLPGRGGTWPLTQGEEDEQISLGTRHLYANLSADTTL